MNAKWKAVALLGLALVILPLLFSIMSPPIDGYWRSSRFDCMCGHENLLRFSNGQATYFRTVHQSAPVDLGSLTWDEDRTHATPSNRPNLIFRPGWIRFTCVDIDANETFSGFRELRPWVIRRVLSHFGAEPQR